jgi:hypothetical protein
MLVRRDGITNEVLGPITFVLAYPTVLGATVQNIVVLATRRPEIVQPCFCASSFHVLVSIVSTVLLQHHNTASHSSSFHTPQPIRIPRTFSNKRNKETHNTTEKKINPLSIMEFLPSNQLPIRHLRR